MNFNHQQPTIQVATSTIPVQQAVQTLHPFPLLLRLHLFPLLLRLHLFPLLLRLHLRLRLFHPDVPTCVREGSSTPALTSSSAVLAGRDLVQRLR